MLKLEEEETEEELSGRYRHERNGQRKIRLQVFRLLRQGKSQAHVAKIIGVPHSMVKRWVGWYREKGLAEVLSRLPGGDHGEEGSLNSKQKQALPEEARVHGFLTAWDAGDWIESHLGVHYRYDSLQEKPQAGETVLRNLMADPQRIRRPTDWASIQENRQQLGP